ncbi:MAG: hypothetical protein ACT4PL_10405 [Phycisphaerales bacterium]
MPTPKTTNAQNDEGGPSKTPPGLIHTYLAYDPRHFPSPTAPGPDLASAAMEHMLRFGNTRNLTPEELARAVKLDPSMFPGLGPGIDALREMLEARKRAILAKYETQTAQRQAKKDFDHAAREVRPDARRRADFQQAIKHESIAELENLWSAERDEQSQTARALLRTITTLGIRYEVEDLAARYAFSGQTPCTPEEAVEIKQELEAIDRLLKQLEEAARNATIGVIDLDELQQFAESAQIEELNRLQRQIEDYLRSEAARQGVEATNRGFALSPAAYRLFQSRVLAEIFSDLEASRSGRHTGLVVGEGAVELQRTRNYAFGDPAANLDVPQSILNAAARAPGARPTTADLAVHLTRNNPRCATVVLLDMSGSMRHGGQYVNVKRMGLALDGLLRREYPGDFLRFVEIATFARPIPASDLATLLPKPVSTHGPVVRLRADMSDPDMNEAAVPQHFTNIQRGLQVARRLLAGQDTPNRQVMLITDGLPTAHVEGQYLYMLYPPDQRTEEATMREARAAAREQITINIFLLPSWAQTSEDVRFAQTMAEATRGRVFFSGGSDLDRFVLWDYVSMRRSIIA